MSDYEQIYNDTLKQEEKFILPHFSKKDAFNIGVAIHNLAQKREQSISVEIDMNSQIVFKVSNLSEFLPR